MGTDSQFGTIKQSSAGVGGTTMLVYLFIFYFLAAPHGLQDLSSSTRD